MDDKAVFHSLETANTLQGKYFLSRNHKLQRLSQYDEPVWAPSRYGLVWELCPGHNAKCYVLALTRDGATLVDIHKLIGCSKPIGRLIVPVT